MYKLSLTKHSGKSEVYHYQTEQALINHVNEWYDTELETLEQVLDYLSTDYRSVVLSR